MPEEIAQQYASSKANLPDKPWMQAGKTGFIGNADTHLNATFFVVFGGSHRLARTKIRLCRRN
jgi:hypothetical protein